MFPVLALKRQWKIILSSPPIPRTCLAHKTRSGTEMPGLMETRIGNSAVDSLISQDMLPCMCPQVPSASTVVGSEWGRFLTCIMGCLQMPWGDAGDSPRCSWWSCSGKGDGTESDTHCSSCMNSLWNLKYTCLPHINWYLFILDLGKSFKYTDKQIAWPKSSFCWSLLWWALLQIQGYLGLFFFFAWLISKSCSWVLLITRES